MDVLRILEVSLGRVRIGTLSNYGQYFRFRPDPAWAADPRRLTASLSLVGVDDKSTSAILASATDARFSDTRLMPMFASLLPEGEFGRRRLAEARGCAEDDEIELLAAAGNDLQGAFVVRPLGAADVAQDVVEWHATLGREPVMGDQIVEPLEDGFSLSGVTPKFSMVQDGRRYTFHRHGQTGSVIVKLPSKRHPCMARNEFVAMKLAEAAGADVAAAELCPLDRIDLPAHVRAEYEAIGVAEGLVVQRFDRLADGERVHMEDFCQALAVQPRHKYGKAESYEAILVALDRHPLATRTVTDPLEFFRRQVINILVGNTDAHLKNWSVVYPDGKHFQLSKAYDIVSVSSLFGEVSPAEYGVNRAIDRKLSELDSEDMVAIAERRRIKAASKVEKVVRDTVLLAQREWPRLLDELDAPASMREHVESRLAGLPLAKVRRNAQSFRGG